MRRITFLLLYFLFGKPVTAQTLFTNPLLIPPVLAGTFAEIRSNHFHSGIDLRTNESEGLPVLAAADGFVSRIKVSPTGFGKVVYLKHASGYTTVYAHLHHFNDTLEKLIESEQYRKKSFEVELFPPEGSLPVKQGQLIGFSGNTGSSAGPHLHFEIRDTQTEMPFNPLSKFNPIPDSLTPVIRNIMVIDYVPFRNTFYPVAKKILPVNDPEAASVEKHDTISYSSLAGIAVETDDRMNGSNALLGVRKIMLKVNGKVEFHFEADRFSFSETRFVNACIDYATLIEQGKNFVLLHHLPGNDFSAISTQKNQGFLDGGFNLPVQCEVVVSDFNGNAVSKSFYIRKEKQHAFPSLPEENRYIAFNKTPFAQNENARLVFPAGRVTYNIHDFKFSTIDSSIAGFSAFVMAGSASVPLHQSCELYIRTENLPAPLQSKALIVRITDKNEKISMGGVFQDGWVRASVRTLGNFYVTIDTLSPEIKPLGISEDAVWQRKKISFRLTDNLSGIDTYELTVNGRWVPAHFDAKSGELFYVIPAAEKAEERKVKVAATDPKGNKSVFNDIYNF